MSVHQVEEYYIYISVPKESIISVANWLDNNTPEDFEFNKENGDLTIDGYDMESQAEQDEIEIMDIINK